jgi:tetratricopeptide (TPR) repeat protein
MRTLYPAWEPDLFGVYFEFTDSVGHLFMKHMEPPMSDVSAADARKYGGAMTTAYAEADRIIGDAMGLVDDSTVLIILSDHGFKSGDMRPVTDSRIGHGQAIAWHRINGSIAMYGDIVKNGYEIEDASVMDIAPTVLYLLGLPVDRKMTGKVLLDALEESYVESHPVTYTDRYDSLIVRPGAPVEGSAADKALRDKLVSLGYVAGGSRSVVNLANYYHKNGQYEKALELWKQLAEQEPDNLDARTGIGNAYFELGKVDVAIREIQSVLETHPKHMKALHSLVTIYIETGRPREALEYADRAIQADPKDGNSHLDRAMALGLLGRQDEAAHAYHKAIELAPDLAEAYANLSQIYAARGRNLEALDLARKAVELASGQPEMHYVFGVALDVNGRSSEALDQFMKAISADSDFVPAYVGACGALLAQGKIDSCLVLCDTALRIPSQYAPFVHNIKGTAYLSRGESGKAVEQFEAAIDKEPTNVPARISLARLRIQQGSRDEAAEHLQAVLRVHPGHPEASALLKHIGR